MGSGQLVLLVLSRVTQAAGISWKIDHIPLVVQNHAAPNSASFMVIDVVSHKNVMEMVGSRKTIKIIRRGMVGKGRRGLRNCYTKAKKDHNDFSV